MNFEINLLSKRKATTNPLHLILFIALVLVLLAVTAVWFQYNSINKAVTVSSEELTNAIAADNASMGQGSIESVIYQEITHALSNPNDLYLFDASNSSENIILVELRFDSLDQASDFAEDMAYVETIETIQADEPMEQDDGSYLTSAELTIMN